MKLKLNWLRKRSDSSSISVRPQPEEAQAWADGFNKLMANKCKYIYKCINLSMIQSVINVSVFI